jgi:succinoglycan biosynthesis protein ExoO
MVEYLMHSYALDFLQEMPGCTRPVTMIDTYDVAHQLCEARQRHGERVPFLVNREEEQEILSTFDIIIAIQDQDRRTFEAMLPGRTVVTCLPACEANPVPPSTDQSTSLIFVGGDSRKNSYGLMQFLKHAWPRVRNVHSDADLTVVGTVCRRFEEESYPGVFFEGYVDDLRESYARADVAICPVTYGGGLKIKVFEALAFGRPVVATMHSAIGFSVTEGNGLLVADDWESFAAILNDLFDDQGRVRAMGQSAAEYVDREFSESYVMRDLVAAMCQHLTQRAAHKGQA